jgi:hypothetical protein
MTCLEIPASGRHYSTDGPNYSGSGKDDPRVESFWIRFKRMINEVFSVHWSVWSDSLGYGPLLALFANGQRVSNQKNRIDGGPLQASGNSRECVRG